MRCQRKRYFIQYKMDINFEPRLFFQCEVQINQKYSHLKRYANFKVEIWDISTIEASNNQNTFLLKGCAE